MNKIKRHRQRVQTRKWDGLEEILILQYIVAAKETGYEFEASCRFAKRCVFIT